MSSACRSLSLKRVDQRRLGLVGVADDADHLVDVQQHELPAFEDVDAVQHLGQPVLRAPLHRGHGGTASHSTRIWRRLFCVGRPSAPIIVRLIGDELSRLVCASSSVDQLLLVDACGSSARTPGAPRASLLDSSRTASSTASTRGLELRLLGRQRLLAGLHLRVGELLDLLQHLLRAGARRQLVDHELPLAARQVLDLPARAHLQAAAAAGVGRADVVGAADDLAAAGEVRARGSARRDRRRRACRFFSSATAAAATSRRLWLRHLGGQADGDAAGAVEQHERQPRRQQLRLLRASRRSWG